MEKSRKKLVKILNEKKKENQELSEKIDNLRSEKMSLQEEVTGLKENREQEAKKVAKMETADRSEEDRGEAGVRAKSQLSVVGH